MYTLQTLQVSRGQTLKNIKDAISKRNTRIYTTPNLYPVTPTTILHSAKYDIHQQQLSHNPLHTAVIDYNFGSRTLANTVHNNTLSSTLRRALQAFSPFFHLLYATLDYLCYTLKNMDQKKHRANKKNRKKRSQVMTMLSVNCNSCQRCYACERQHAQPSIPAYNWQKCKFMDQSTDHRIRVS
jgi:TPP-dependent indolepyruvate ferredoxin oxidoreductase alpha subunit